MDDVLTNSDIAGLFQSVAKITSAKPYKISVDFNKRFRVWTTQILPGRINEIQREDNVEFVHRMITLLFADGAALTNRAIKDGGETVQARIHNINQTVEDEIVTYIAEVNKIKLSQLNIKD